MHYCFQLAFVIWSCGTLSVTSISSTPNFSATSFTVNSICIVEGWQGKKIKSELSAFLIQNSYLSVLVSKGQHVLQILVFQFIDVPNVSVKVHLHLSLLFNGIFSDQDMSATFFLQILLPIQRFLFLKEFFGEKMCTFTPRIAPSHREGCSSRATLLRVHHHRAQVKPSKRPIQSFLELSWCLQAFELGAIRQSNHSKLEHLENSQFFNHTLVETTEFIIIKHTSKNPSSIFCRFFTVDVVCT